MPVAPQVPNDPVDVTGTFEEAENNLVFEVDSEDLAATNNNVQEALDDANAALAQAQSAFTLASGSLQKSANTITNAQNQLTAINGNGVTVYAGASPSSGARVVMNSAGIAGFNATESEATFAINASNGSVSMRGASFTGGTIFGGQLNINGNCIINSQGFLTATGATITGTITGSTIQSSSISTTLAISTSGQMSAGSLTVSNGLTNNGFGIFNGATSFDSFLTANGAVTTNSTLIANGTTSLPGTLNQTTTSAANVRINTNTGLLLQVTSSSERFKQDITPIEEAPAQIKPDALLDVPVRAFKYRPGYIDPDDQRADSFIPGFIAEELAEKYPIAADYDDDGLPVDWNFRYIVPGLLALIQRQQQQISALEARVTTLENAS